MLLALFRGAAFALLAWNLKQTYALSREVTELRTEVRLLTRETAQRNGVGG